MLYKEWPHRHHASLLTTCAIVLIAYAVRLIFLPSTGRTLPYVTFYPAVVLAAIYGGFYHGLAACIFSIVVTVLCIIHVEQLFYLSLMEWVIQVSFPVLSILLSYSIEIMYQFYANAQEKNRQLERTNKELIQQRQNYQTLVENLPFKITRFDDKFHCLYVHPAIENTANLTLDEIVTGETTVTDPKLAQMLFAQCMSVFSKKVSIEANFESSLGYSPKYFHTTIIPEFDKEGTVQTILLVSRDLSLEKQIQKELSRLDQLNVIGEMAASIGHEVRNPLTTVRGYLQLFQSKEQFIPYNEQVTTMIGEIDRANDIITEFLSLAKNKAVNMECCNLNDNITSLMPLLEADALHSGHNLEIILGNIPNLYIDPKEIRQVLLNLVRNAFEATPPNGKITIRTALIDEQVVLSVTDTGEGIPKEIKDKIGTPFVTTKEKGTGLGLSVCYRIADRHGATLHFTTGSEGTTFFFTFKQKHE